eukprot:TRINITY_DN7594_c0_g4_i1.p1 TRINITY_DN7594_c0_g4~~TRINITY_DN7594_c0_g4_i1.p1  ORF type:complete len:408 (+),score=23.82 TRINITY_DN7594_c0_g4_i1:135-1226(+)
MEKKPKVSPQKEINYNLHGDPIMFATEEDELPFRPHLNYVFTIQDASKVIRRIHSVEIPQKSHNTSPGHDNEVHFLKDVVIELNDPKAHKEETKTLSRTTKFVRNKWALLRTVLRAVALFRRNEVESIRDTEGLEKALESYQPRFRSLSHYQQRQQSIFEEIAKEDQLFKLIARGAHEDIEQINTLLTQGREANLFDPSDDNYIINRPNRFGHTPLYIASQNGNLEVIKYLLAHKANVFKKSKVSSKEEESNLAVASRWKHEGIVKYYLDAFNWPIADLQQAKALAGTKKIQKILSRKLNKDKKGGCCLFCIPRKDNKTTSQIYNLYSRFICRVALVLHCDKGEIVQQSNNTQHRLYFVVLFN